MRKILFSIIVAIVCQACGVALAEEDCPAPKAWFASSGTPAPNNAEPKRGNDCAFYQWAWQTFLYVTDTARGNPRFLGYKTYADVFGPDRRTGLMAPSGNLMVLAPRLVKAAQATQAEDVFQAGSSAVLLDQNGHVVFYNILMNPAFVNFVQKNGFIDVNKLIAAPAAQELPVGAVEFKAAWQIVPKDDPPKDRIVVQAQVPWLIDAGNGKLKVDGSRPLRPETVALLGLHVVGRTEGHPELIWSTFEYDRNAPSTKGNPLPSATNCVNPEEVIDDTVQDDKAPYLLYATGTATSDANRKPTNITIIDAESQIFAPKTPIVRVFPFAGCSPARSEGEGQVITEIDPAIVALNKSAKIQIKDPKRMRYSLVGAVWLDDPRNPNDNRGFREGRAFEDFELGGENRLSSTSMESFTQTGAPNCFSCHDTRPQEQGKLAAKRLNISHIFSRLVREKSQQ